MTRLALLLALIWALQVRAAPPPDICTCLWQGSFTEVVDTADLVILGRVSSRKGNAVDIVPIHQYRGNTWLDAIRVWMRTGDYCRPDAAPYVPGSEWVLALQKIDQVPEDGFNPSTPNQSYGRRGDYLLSACGGYWLQVRGQTVTGNLLPGTPRWNHEPDMAPVPIALLAAYLRGQTDVAALEEAATEDPALKELLLDTRSFLRGQQPVPDSDEPETPRHEP